MSTYLSLKIYKYNFKVGQEGLHRRSPCREGEFQENTFVGSFKKTHPYKARVPKYNLRPTDSQALNPYILCNIPRVM